MTIAALLDLLDEAYDGRAWHGPTLRGSIRGLSAAEAAHPPTSGRKSIAEVVAHAAYWKYTVHRRLTAAPRGGFALKGSNWFPLPDPFLDAQWRDHIQMLEAVHRDLRATVAGLDPAQLDAIVLGGKTTGLKMIRGIALHDVYHTGQIQLLKRLLPALGPGPRPTPA